MMYLKLQNLKSLLGPPKPGKQWKNAGLLYIFRAAQHPSNTVYSRIQWKQISAGSDITIDSVFVAHVWLPMEFSLWKQPFVHGKNNVVGLCFRNLPGHQTNPPKSQQTRRGWIPEKEKWTIFGRYHGIQAFYPGVYQASGRHHKSLVAIGQTWVPHGLRRSALNDQQWTNSVPKCVFTCQHAGKLGLKTSPFQIQLINIL